MRAMVLAAGLGTRLRPLTDERPKALIEVGGRTLLQIMLDRLRAFGVREVIVNVHHHAGMIVEYLGDHNSFGIRVEVSEEKELLDTGGGLRKAAWFFLEDPDRLDEPFILHNVDVLTSIDLERMRQFHQEHEALVTLAVQDRPTSRPLLFDAEGLLSGHRAGDSQATIVRDAPDLVPREFTGVHVMTPRIFSVIGRVMKLKAGENRPFSIIPAYLKMAGAGERIQGFPADAWSWRDVGTPESLDEVRDAI